MLSRFHLGPRFAILALLAVLAPATVHAADAPELDKYLPIDTEIYVRANLKQAFESKLAKAGIEQVRDLLKNLEDVNEVLKDLGFDPFSDLESMTVAAPNSNDQDRVLVILHGKFNLDKFKAKGEEVAKNQGDLVKLHKVADGSGGQVTVFEVRIPAQDQSLFVALANDTTVLASPGKDYVADAIKRGKGKGPVALKNKQFQALLEKINPKQTLAVAGLGEALAKNSSDGTLKELLAKTEVVGGGVTLDDDIKIELVIGAKTEQEAKELKSTINDYVTKGLLVVGLLATQQKALEPAVDVLKSIRCTAKEKAVTIKVEISAEVIAAAIQKALGG